MPADMVMSQCFHCGFLVSVHGICEAFPTCDKSKTGIACTVLKKIPNLNTVLYTYLQYLV